MVTRAISGRPFTRSNPSSWLAIRPDAAIEEEIWHHLQKEYYLGPGCQNHLAVEVTNGRVYLTGHLPTVDQCDLADRIASRVKGVAWVQNDLVIDQYLHQQIFRALAEDENTYAYIIPIRVSYGWVSLGGIVPADEAALAAEAVVANVPYVRGIIALPSVIYHSNIQHENVMSERRTLQPRQGSAVYCEQGEGEPAEIGLVSQVILDPYSRLATHIAIKPCLNTTEADLDTHFLIPMEAVEAASNRSIWLKEGTEIARHPAFDLAEYPAAPKEWRPPFPYKPGMVRWSWKVF